MQHFKQKSARSKSPPPRPRLRVTRVSVSVALAALCLSLSGCLGGGSFLPGKKEDKAPPPLEPLPMVAQAVPYTISAQASGAFITVSVTNTGTADLQVSPADFAMIPQGTRRVVPYSPECATIDIPRSVAPGQTVQGRARFREFENPAGNRLVFKPDNRGTFAVISGQPIALDGGPKAPAAKTY